MNTRDGQAEGHDPLLVVQDLVVRYGRAGMDRPPAVRDVSLRVRRAEIVALVGESGSGKSTIGKAVIGAIPLTSGSIRIGGQDIADVRRDAMRHRGVGPQMIYQNPLASLNPARRVGRSLAEPLRVSLKLSKAEATRRVGELLDRVGLPADAADRYPGEFSGGQRQRIAIARAVSLRPALIVCDEPTSALDVSTQAGILELLASIRSQSKVSMLFISHDLAVVRSFADLIVVLSDGAVVEQGDPAQVCAHPGTGYTRRLIADAPVPNPVRQAERRAARMAERPVPQPETAGLTPANPADEAFRGRS